MMPLVADSWLTSLVDSHRLLELEVDVSFVLHPQPLEVPTQSMSVFRLLHTVSWAKPTPIGTPTPSPKPES